MSILLIKRGFNDFVTESWTELLVRKGMGGGGEGVCLYFNQRYFKLTVVKNGIIM